MSRDTMVDTIALTSPDGHMSKRARKAAEERLRVALFGKDGLQPPTCPQPSEQKLLLRTAKQLRDIAARGMSPRKHIKQAEKLESQARKGTP